MITENSVAWKAQRKGEALAFRADFEALVASIKELITPSAFDPHARHLVEMTFARGRSSQHWFTLSLDWAVAVALFDAQIESDQKDDIILCPGPLTGGRTEVGTRKIKENVEGLDIVFFDFDKGDAPLVKLQERLTQLGLESAAFATFSHLKDTTALAWSVTRPNAKTGQLATMPSALQSFVRARRGINECRADEVTAGDLKAFMVEEQGFDAAILGQVTIIDHNMVERAQIKTKAGWQTHETINLVVKHAPLAKSRLAIPLASRFARQPGETTASFQDRWKDEVYLPIGELIGFRYDHVCASTERGHYAVSRNANRAPIPLVRTSGRLLDVQDGGIQALLAPFKRTRNEPRPQARHERACSDNIEDGTRETNNWLGFQAADAAVELLCGVTDKRSDTNSPLAAFACPFVHEHATSNDPSARQCYCYNASAADRLPTIKCQSDTCRDRPYIEFLDALFDDAVKADPTFRLPQRQPTGVMVHERELPAKLEEINQAWAVVRLGNRVRYLHETPEGDIELYDAKSLTNWFSNWFYYWINDRGDMVERPILSAWLRWQFRRQYRGVRFCPEPEGTPNGVYNTYFGFTVAPQRGSWRLLLGHIYRNVCRRDAKNFRFFIAWLAQLVQEPHIKPGTNLVLRGKEGVGKSKVGEWVVALFGRNAMVVSEAERITGRFNAHLENKILLMAEEAFWAGDKAAEGKLKDLATGMNMSYERKGLDPYEGQNYTRIMIASNEDWVVPASSGGRRWFVLECGDDHEKDYAYFQAIDEEMRAAGLAAMLYDLQRSPLPQTVNVRSAPVTDWLVEQRLHSYDNKHRWWRGALLEGGLRDNESGTFIALDEEKSTAVRREEVFLSARPYFLGPRGVDPSPSEVGQFIFKMLGELPETRPTIDGKRQWCTIFPSLREMRQRWLEATGEHIAPTTATDSAPVAPTDKVTNDPQTATHESYPEKRAVAAMAKAVKEGVTDPDAVAAVGQRAASAAKTTWAQLAAQATKTGQ